MDAERRPASTSVAMSRSSAASGSRGFPPSLKLRRTTEALPEAVSRARDAHHEKHENSRNARNDLFHVFGVFRVFYVLGRCQAPSIRRSFFVLNEFRIQLPPKPAPRPRA